MAKRTICYVWKAVKTLRVQVTRTAGKVAVRMENVGIRIPRIVAKRFRQSLPLLFPLVL